MKKGKKTVACAIAAAVSLSAFSGLVGMTKLGPLGADVVSAATGTTTPAQAPKKTTTTKKTTTSTKATTTTQTTSVTRILKLGSKGSDVKTLQTLLNNNGYKLVVDGVFGNKTLAAVKSFQKANGLWVDGIVGPKTLAVLKPVATVAKTQVKLGKAEYAAHGTKCFTVAVVAMAGDKIADVIIDDYQVMDASTSAGVPNSNVDFGKNFAEGKVLGSKLVNAAQYSKNMKEKGGATLSVNENFSAVEAFAIGKTIAELEAAIKANPADPKIDAVSGATLADTNGYLNAIVAAAKNANGNRAIEIDEAELSSLKVEKAEYAAHGTKCFTVASVAVAGDKIVGAMIDDYQVMDKTTSTGVPNSNVDFGKNFAEGKVLGSKLVNADQYSKNMKAKGGATLSVNENFKAVEEFAIGKTIAELEVAILTNPADPKVDAVSGATLADTNGYLNAILSAAKGETATATRTAESKIVKMGLGHLISISKSTDLAQGKGALGQVDTVIVAAGFDKDGKVVSITIDNAQTKVQFNDDLTLKSDPKAELKTKVELKEAYGMIKASTIQKEWYQQAESLGKWMIGKTVDEIMGMKVKQRDEAHPAVPDIPDLVASVTITVNDYQKALKEAYENAVEVKAGAVKLGLGHDISIAKSKGISTAADGTKVGPLAQVDTVMTAAAFDKDGKICGVIIDNGQTKINFDKDGKVTTDKKGEFKTKVELKEAYGMIKASTIKKEWYQQAKALGDWMVGKTVELVKGMGVKQRDEAHPAVPTEPDLVASVTITVNDYQKTLGEAFQNAK